MISTTPTVRPATLSDSAAVFFLAQAFATSFTVERSAFDASLAALLDSPDALLAVATDHHNAILGYVLGFTHRTFYANGPVAWVEEITVTEDMRRSGIGRHLMDYFEQWAAERNARLVALATRRAAAFYQSLGYEESAAYFRKLL